MDKSEELTISILKSLKKENDPVGIIIEGIIEKALNDEYIKGYNRATNHAIKTIENL
tara:strand:- start:842 stop:1012 length:171 start_codon:yes stop_codon:yes gene_type:complete